MAKCCHTPLTQRFAGVCECGENKVGKMYTLACLLMATFVHRRNSVCMALVHK